MKLPIICELGIRTEREVDDYDYLEKILPEEMLDRTFRSLVDYMVDIETDELNPISYNEEQKDLANVIIRWYEEATRFSSDDLRSRVGILRRNVGKDMEEKAELTYNILRPYFSRDGIRRVLEKLNTEKDRGFYYLKDSIRDKLDEILELRFDTEKGITHPYLCIDLIIRTTWTNDSEYIKQIKNESIFR